jgi:chromate transport protein ChrA
MMRLINIISHTIGLFYAWYLAGWIGYSLYGTWGMIVAVVTMPLSGLAAIIYCLVVLHDFVPIIVSVVIWR